MLGHHRRRRGVDRLRVIRRRLGARQVRRLLGHQVVRLIQDQVVDLGEPTGEMLSARAEARLYDMLLTRQRLEDDRAAVVLLRRRHQQPPPQRRHPLDHRTHPVENILDSRPLLRRIHHPPAMLEQPPQDDQDQHQRLALLARDLPRHHPMRPQPHPTVIGRKLRLRRTDRHPLPRQRPNPDPHPEPRRGITLGLIAGMPALELRLLTAGQSGEITQPTGPHLRPLPLNRHRRARRHPRAPSESRPSAYEPH